jgi:sugar-phosphatase
VVAAVAAVFDLDGLLVDSEVLWHKAEVEILVPLGAAIDPEGARTTKGMFVREVVAHHQRLAGFDEGAIDALTAAVLARVGDLVEAEGRLLPGATRALDLCAERGPLALASSTPMALIHRILGTFGLDDAFAVVRSAEDEARGKPDPAVYRSAAAALHVDPERCIAFEDAPAGVRSAVAAGMRCVAVPARGEEGDGAFALATLVLDSLASLEVAWLDSQYAADVDGLRRR